MNNQEIALRMRQGVARFWPDAHYQVKGTWFIGVKRCFGQMLAASLGCSLQDDILKIAGRAICKAAGIDPVERPLEGVTVLNYILGLNEGWKAVKARPFAELVQLVHAAADLLDGGQPAEGEPAESEPATQTPVDIPPQNPTEQPNPQPQAYTPLPLSLQPESMIEDVTKVKEKEYA